LLRATRKNGDVYLELANDLPSRLIAAAGDLPQMQTSELTGAY
jgi:hypothetical protein